MEVSIKYISWFEEETFTRFVFNWHSKWAPSHSDLCLGILLYLPGTIVLQVFDAAAEAAPATLRIQPTRIVRATLGQVTRLTANEASSEGVCLFAFLLWPLGTTNKFITFFDRGFWSDQKRLVGKGLLARLAFTRYRDGQSCRKLKTKYCSWFYKLLTCNLLTCVRRTHT